MRRITTLLVITLAFIYANAQETGRFIPTESALTKTHSRSDMKWIRKGQNPYGEILFNLDGNWIRKGQNPYGDILYNIDGKWVRKGQNPYGEILFSID
jgi:hypothetical protein